MKVNFHDILKQFVSHKDKFKLVFQNASRPVLTPTTRQILILDSSFNPPHLGHLSMIKQSILDIKSHDFGISSINTKSVLLMFSIRNADKQSSDIGQYVSRLQMMEALCEHINEELGVPCGICITDASLFVHKGELVSGWVNDSKVENIFLVGYDTIVRIFDQKYYSIPVKEIMDPFFKDNSVCVLLREDKTNDYNMQRKYVSNLQSTWGVQKVHLAQANEREMSISSSAIRKDIASGGNKWEEDVIPGVRELLLNK